MDVDSMTADDVTSLAEVWIEIEYIKEDCIIKASHFPCGSVDWNNELDSGYDTIIVTSLAEVWIEICPDCYFQSRRMVTSLAEVWIEIYNQCQYKPYYFVTSLAEVWIEILA